MNHTKLTTTKEEKKYHMFIRLFIWKTKHRRYIFPSLIFFLFFIKMNRIFIFIRYTKTIYKIKFHYILATKSVVVEEL